MPVLKISPTGAITTVDTLANAVPNYDNSGVRVIVTTDQVVDTDITFHLGTSLEITNNASIEVSAGKTLDLSFASFVAPHKDSFAGTGTVVLPPFGNFDQDLDANHITATSVSAVSVSGNLDGSSTKVGGLTVIQGRVSSSGTALLGTGFTSAKVTAGQYLLTWTIPFTTIPTVVCNIDSAGTKSASSTSFSASTHDIYTFALSGNPLVSSAQDNGFWFIAVGVTP